MNRSSSKQPAQVTLTGRLTNLVAPMLKISSLGIFFFVAILTASLFAYIAFYQAVVPDIEFVIPINFRYRTDCHLASESQSETRRCSFPLGNVSLFRSSGLQLLTPGQEYAFTIKLDVPESEINYNIGNFLVSLEVFGSNNQMQYSETENVLLSYRSLLFAIMRTVLLLPLLMLGYVDQRQTLRILYEKTFTESLFAPSHYLIIQLHSRYLQFYKANLVITAQLRGIKYALFAYPFLSGAVIVAVLMGLFGMIVLLSVAQRLYSSMSVPPPGNSGVNGGSDMSSMASSTPRSASPSPSYSPSRPVILNGTAAGDQSGTNNEIRFRPIVARSKQQPADDWSPASTSPHRRSLDS